MSDDTKREGISGAIDDNINGNTGYGGIAGVVHNSMGENTLILMNKMFDASDKIEASKLQRRLNNFEKKLKTGVGPLEWLTRINDWLESVPATVAVYFNTIFKSAENISQEAVDLICTYAAWFVNYNVEKMRQKIIKSLYEQYGYMFAAQKQLNKVKEMATNPMGVLHVIASILKSILNMILGPIAFVVKYLYNVVKEVVRLAENLAMLATVLPPPPPSPHINYHAFKLQIGKMGTSILTEDPSSMPTPIEMFPEPIKPFTSEYWRALKSEDSKKTFRKEKVFYSLEDAEKKMSEYNGIAGSIDNYISGNTNYNGIAGAVNDYLVDQDYK